MALEDLFPTLEGLFWSINRKLIEVLNKAGGVLNYEIAWSSQWYLICFFIDFLLEL